ncbi:hypothetical protein RND81_14G156600 [Saponaria officinalis]|uniref:Uncharacterized protein n=1 Tax=Saponaria officinalis TaxID=3572 RepID=A0AAW1GQZ9_SAPOF
MISDSIQPPDIWHSNGVKYFVSFNEFYQPIKKGGHILVRFIGDVAKTERFCPIREINWCHVNAQLKVDIIKLIRSVRQYRHYLKKALFKPTLKTKDQIYQAAPSGYPRDSWIHLVDYWYSEKGNKFAERGNEARSAQNHVHTTGSTSYANIRADLEEKNGREPSILEIFKHTHQRKDGTFVKDTITKDFLVNIQTQLLLALFFTKSRVQIENEAFNKLMYGDDVPKRPLGYGYGVKQSDVYGVHGILRKERFYGDGDGDNNALALQRMEKVVADLKDENKGLVKDHEELKTKFDESNFLMKKMTSQFGQILDVLGTGKAPVGFLDIAKKVLHTSNSEVFDFVSGSHPSK